MYTITSYYETPIDKIYKISDGKATVHIPEWELLRLLKEETSIPVYFGQSFDVRTRTWHF